jgi:N-acetylmuramoyl-L-alanine amidase
MKETTAILTPNQWSRPGGRINVRGIIIHWVENPKTSAMFNRDWFEGRKTGHYDYGSAHDIVGLDGEIVHCIPYDEMAYHVGAYNYLPPALSLYGAYPNNSTLGIELTHPDWTGKPTGETESAAAELCCGLCINYGLDPLTRIQTHSWVTGKLTKRGPCHKWYVEHPDAFNAFRSRVRDMIGDTL